MKRPATAKKTTSTTRIIMPVIELLLPKLSEPTKHPQQDTETAYGEHRTPKHVERGSIAQSLLDLFFGSPGDQKRGFVLALPDHVAIVLVLGRRILNAGAGDIIPMVGQNAVLCETVPSGIAAASGKVQARSKLQTTAESDLAKRSHNAANRRCRFRVSNQRFITEVRPRGGHGILPAGQQFTDPSEGLSCLRLHALYHA